MPDATISDLGLFQGEEHKPFLWEVGRPAVLLIHGFMGTPAEMRPLGEAFRQEGWTAQGLLLPGFGPELDSLFERRYQEWVDAATAALDRLQERNRPVLLIGYSMGAAVALNVGARRSLDGLVLLAPFWRIGSPVQRIIWQVIKRVFRRPRPFNRANFEDPRIRELFGGLLPDLNLSDPMVQASLRQLRVPTSFADQIFAVGKKAEKAAHQIDAATLIIQGMNDEAVRPQATRRLLRAFPGTIQYREIEADHEIVRPENPGYVETAAAMTRFAADRLVKPDQT